MDAAIKSIGLGAIEINTLNCIVLTIVFLCESSVHVDSLTESKSRNHP